MPCTNSTCTQLVTVTDTVTEWDRAPFVPVTTTLKLPGARPHGVVIVSVETADPPDVSVTVVGLRVAVMLTDEGVAVRIRLPENIFRLVSVMVDVVELPADKLTDAGLAVMLKSPTLTSTCIVWTCVPLVPVTVTVKLPLAVGVTVNNDVAIPPAVNVTLVGLKDAVRPVEGVTDAVRLTVPVKPLTLVRVMVDVPEEPTWTVMTVGFAVMLKSVHVTVTVSDWGGVEGLVPVTVTVKLPVAEQVTVRMDVADPPDVRVTLAALSVRVRPAGDEVAVSVTVPANPPWLVTVMVEVPDSPTERVRVFGLAATLKVPCGTTVMVAEWDNPLLVPVTVTVNEVAGVGEQVTVKPEV